jgi:hypothetical protein
VGGVHRDPIASLRRPHRTGVPGAPGGRPSAARRGRLWLAALVLLALAITAVAAQLGVIGGESAAAGPPPATGPAARYPTTDPEPGALTAGGAALLPVAGIAGPDGDLAHLAGRPVRGRAVVVESVPADEGFWVGTGGADRVWVQLAGAGKSPYRVRAGEHVDLSGQVAAHGPAYPAAVGLGPGAEADLLTRQGAHLEVAQRDLRLVPPG